MLSVLCDENFNHRILRGLRLRATALDCVIAQNAGLKGASDDALLEWAADQGRILLTHDLQTIPKHAYARIERNLTMRGVLAVPKRLPIGQAIEDLTLVGECCGQDEFDNRILYLPL